MERDKVPHRVVLENPPIKKVYQTIKAGISRHKTVIIVGNCWVNYDGRASSKLEPGERIVLFKTDGSALIHRPRDYAPVNWQPPGSLFRTMLKEDQLYIRVFRRKGNEVLEISFDHVILVAILDLSDVSEFHLYASEEDMQRAILTEPSLLEEGFRPLAAERPVEPGFIDILGVDKNNVLMVVEIKRKAANKEAALQLKKYMDVFTANSDRQVRGILVAPELARGTQKMLSSLDLEFKALSPQRCTEILKLEKSKQLTDFFSY